MSIKIITEPSVYVIARQTIDGGEVQRFLDDESIESWHRDTSATTPESIVELAGRTCYMSFKNPRPGGNKAYIGHILEVGHGSVLEHAVWTLLVTGISRSCSHELVRHRVGISPSQLSQRFVDESECAFVVPPLLLALGKEHIAWEEWRSLCDVALGDYSSLSTWLEAESSASTATLRRKRDREAARSVLPNCVETKIVLTGNARAWRHFIELRCSPEADAEIARLAERILAVLKTEAPNIFGDYELVTEPDGRVRAVTSHRKV